MNSQEARESAIQTLRGKQNRLLTTGCNFEPMSMEWIAFHRAFIDCRNKILALQNGLDPRLLVLDTLSND